MKNLTWHGQSVSRKDREKLIGQRGAVIWFTGISGSGKSTLANSLAKRLHEMGKLTYVLDGDNIRHGLNRDLGFTKEERTENIRRVGEVAKLLADAGVLTMTCFISPHQKDRDGVRKLMKGRFIEVYVRCPLKVCEGRDPKGLYKKARAGDISDFTAVSYPYEKPKNPDITLDTGKNTEEENTKKLLDYLALRKLI